MIFLQRSSKISYSISRFSRMIYKYIQVYPGCGDSRCLHTIMKYEILLFGMYRYILVYISLGTSTYQNNNFHRGARWTATAAAARRAAPLDSMITACSSASASASASESDSPSRTAGVGAQPQGRAGCPAVTLPRVTGRLRVGLGVSEPECQCQ